ncbi:Oxo-4-hydroxy-4-carboxy-5-ureidoimidazoline decarboxylase [Mycotypha africana]|uniref:Oxo-4-hydroxy-4-carboxy-5-ureidoimidazoline decarboxylase n=1 Tax=Mycotypha africana TaxID=64632 RepID=UPI0022FFD12A|nr:Oxo-4-hydroxy-4-carboxy-5-ureidoimidazoline decarboxylase [Mycotypha africana]KAI8987624.1 Oxo-4-hydroxy-4-carboxy-5-ureidoimidazoline decarboxylase [Mycotypha africana]
MSALPSIDQLNRETNPDDFVQVVNTLFEAAPPLAKKLLDARPFTSYNQLIDYAEKVCLSPDDLTEAEKLEVMNAHPRIGAAKTGLSANSMKEQGYSSTSQLSAEDEKVNAELAKLNKEYEDKYGFKFVVFVNGRPRHQIIPVIKERIASGDKEKEFHTGITDMMLIARDRLKKATVSKI